MVPLSRLIIEMSSAGQAGKIGNPQTGIRIYGQHPASCDRLAQLAAHLATRRFEVALTGDGLLIDGSGGNGVSTCGPRHSDSGRSWFFRCHGEPTRWDPLAPVPAIRRVFGPGR